MPLFCKSFQGLGGTRFNCRDVMAVRFFGFPRHPRNPSPNSWQWGKGKNHICILRTNNMVKLKTTTSYHYHSIKTKKINNVNTTTYSTYQYLYIDTLILLISFVCIEIFLYSHTAIFSRFVSIFICFWNPSYATKSQKINNVIITTHNKELKLCVVILIML